MATGMKKIYKSMQGREVDMTRLANQHETTIPVGNARATASGDQLTPNGTIVRAQQNASIAVNTQVKVPIQNKPLRASQEVTNKPVKTSSKSN